VGKLILFLIVGLAIYWWLRRPAAKPGKTAAGERDAETMVSCAYCGLHVPQKECVADHGRYYCGEEHRRLADRSGRD
jgi:uncharacterized protein